METSSILEQPADDRRVSQVYRRLVDTVQDYAIFALDAAGKVMTWNAGAKRLKGYEADEIIGKHFSIFYPPERVAEGFPDYELREAARVGRFEDEGWRIRKDGSRFWANVVITALRDEHGDLDGFAKVVRDLTERRAAEQQALELARRLATEQAVAREAIAREEELRRINAELDRRRAEAEAAVRSRDEMLSIVSHDLRNPVGTVFMSASLLRDSELELTPPQRAKQLEIITRSTERMTRLIEDLLDVARIDAGRLPINCRCEDPGALALEVAESFQAIAAEKTVTLRCQVSPELPRVFIDRDRVVQALSNFLNNAVKFTPPSGLITVLASPDDAGGVAFAVSDTGPGIAAEDLPRVFDRYWQAKRTAHMGSGLGLAIAKGIAEAHHGRVGAESKPGSGSTFVLALPASEQCDTSGSS